MTKICIITDTHFGARNDSPHFNQFFKKFYDNVFFPYLLEAGIKTIVHAGDIFDRRKYINFNTLRNAREYFFEPLRQHGIDMFAIIGNHDTYYKNTNEVNSPSLLLREYENVHLVTSPSYQTIAGKEFAFVPWICEDNLAESLDFMRSGSGICFGHFELDGFEMFRGITNDGGLNKKLLSGFSKVLTGHFHHRSTQDNIYYLGSPYGMTWADHDDIRGFHILDTVTEDLQFIPNPYEIFHKIYYDDKKKQTLDAKKYADSCVKITVVNKENYVKFDKFVQDLYDNNVVELSIHENFADFEEGQSGVDTENVEDTLTLLTDFVDNITTDKDKDRLKTILKTLYVDAQNIEE